MATSPRPAHRDAEHDPDAGAMGAVWSFVGILVAFKVITLLLILYHQRTFETGMFLLATTWFWIPAIGVLVAGPLVFRYRLIRVRARRDQLHRAEWMLHQAADADAPNRGR